MYGQSVFETVSVIGQRPLLLSSHLARLQRGCDALDIPIEDQRLSDEIALACETLPDDQRNILRLTVTMGEGGRGYQNPQQAKPNHIVTAHDFPDYPTDNWTNGVKIGVVDLRLSQQPVLAGFKHSNRLEQTLARSQWQADWQEALTLNEQGKVIEATQSNVFIVSDGKIQTPNLNTAGVAGVMRDFILQEALSLGYETAITELNLNDINNADEVFLTNSVIGLWPVKQCQDHPFSIGSVTQQLQMICQKNELIPHF